MSLTTPPLGSGSAVVPGSPGGPAPLPDATPPMAEPGALSTEVPDTSDIPAVATGTGGNLATGLPPLPEPALQFADGEDLALLLDALGTRIRDAQTRVTAQGLDHARRLSGGVGQGVIDRLTEATTKLTDALGKEKANEVWAWLARSSSFTGALAAQSMSLQPTVGEDGQLTSPPLLALAVLGALSASADLGGLGNIDNLLPPDLRHSGLLQAPDGRLIDLGFSLADADLRGALAEQRALQAEATPEAAARLRLAVSMGVAVTTLTTLLAHTLQRLGVDARDLDLSMPADPAVDQADSALQAQVDRATALVNRVAAGAGQASGDALDARNRSTLALRTAHQTAFVAQLAVRDLVRQQLQIQRQAAQVQIAGQGAAQVSALGVSQDLKQSDLQRADARREELRMTELAMQQEDQREKLREMALALQEALSSVMQQLNASGQADPRLAAVRQKMSV